LKDNFIWNNGITPQEAAQRFTAAAIKVPVRSGVTLDVEEMDSKQNQFTHAINWEFDKLLGIDSDFLEMYYSLYKSYLLVSDMATVDLEWIKPSGAPWTLKGNTFLEFLFQNYVIQGEGPQAVFMQGDDLDRRQANLKVNEQRMHRVSLYCGFKMSAIYSETAEFCGYVYAFGILVPSIRRKLAKLIAAPIRGAEHFYQYAEGIRDWLKDLRGQEHFVDIIKINAEQSKVPESVIYDWLDCIDSTAHVSWEQWCSVAQQVKLEVLYLDEAGYANSVW
jgi:hypothetical protein